MDEILNPRLKRHLDWGMKAILFSLVFAVLMVGCGEIENKKAIPVLTE
jgi:hypothetical protein